MVIRMPLLQAYSYDTEAIFTGKRTIPEALTLSRATVMQQEIAEADRLMEEQNKARADAEMRESNTGKALLKLTVAGQRSGCTGWVSQSTEHQTRRCLCPPANNRNRKHNES